MPRENLALESLLGRDALVNWFRPLDLRETRRQNLQKVSIGIVGAGVAGLCAGHELARLGYKITLLEASPRLGGRLFTHHFSTEQHGELGAMRIPGVHSGVWEYIDRFKLETRRFGSNLLLSHQSIHSDVSGGFQSLYLGLLNEVWRNVPGTALLDLKSNHLSPPFTTYESRSVKEFFSTQMSANKYLNLLAEEHIGAYEESSFFETVLGFMNYKHQDMYEIVGGMERLVTAFAESIRSQPGCEIFPLTAVESIHTHCQGASIMFRPSAQPLKTLKFDLVICAIPPSALSAILFTPSLPNSTVDCLGFQHIPASKTLALFKKRFWAGNAGGVKYINSPLESIWYPSSDGRVLTVQYGRGEAAQSFSALTSSKREAIVGDTLSKLHPGEHIEIEELVHESWRSPKTGGGGFCRNRPGELRRQCETKPWSPTPPDAPRIFFAGEAYSKTHGWIQGAIESARSTVNEILLRLAKL
jgi:monoamine oxidase